MPIITLGTTEPDGMIVETGTLPDNFYSDLQNEIETQEYVDYDVNTCLVEINENADTEQTDDNNQNNDEANVTVEANEGLSEREDVSEFTVRGDGSVHCKLCGKLFTSRQHWYRHKQKAHAQPPLEPVPLSECEKCHIYFKSRKGYLGHMSSKHGEIEQDFNPGPNQIRWPNSQQSRPTRQVHQKAKPVPATRNTSKPRSLKKAAREYQESSVKDESFVLDIIEKVRRQCETEPEAASRRGYMRKMSIRT